MTGVYIRNKKIGNVSLPYAETTVINGLKGVFFRWEHIGDGVSGPENEDPAHEALVRVYRKDLRNELVLALVPGERRIIEGVGLVFHGEASLKTNPERSRR